MQSVLQCLSRLGLTRFCCRLLNVLRRWRLRSIWMPQLYLPPESIEAQQLEDLKRLLVHAGEHVPYYRDLFQSIGFKPDEIRSLADLSVLPLLTKDIIRHEGERMLADSFSREALQEKSTGGSTGEPLVFYRHKEYLDASRAGTWRNLSLLGWLPGDPIANFWGINDPVGFESRAIKEQIDLGMYTFNAFDAGEHVFSAWLSRLESIRPVIVYGYASTIWLFCKWLEENDIDRGAFSRLKGVCLTAERLHQFQREDIGRVLGVPISNLYGSTEIQNIAFTCKDSQFHVASDFVVVEQGGENGRQLVLTSLHNYAMPFIRYVNGDEGTLEGHLCSCGINMPCMGLDLSRSCDHFRTASGRMIHGEFFTHVMEGIQGVDTFQFRQVSLDRVELLLVRGTMADEETDRHITSLRQVIREKTAGELELHYEWVLSIPPTRMGKHMFTVSEIE